MDIPTIGTFLILFLSNINPTNGHVCLQCDGNFYPDDQGEDNDNLKGTLVATDSYATIDLAQAGYPLITVNELEVTKIHVNTHGSISFRLPASSYVSFCALGLPIPCFIPFCYTTLVYLYHFQLDPCDGDSGVIRYNVINSISSQQTLDRATDQIRDCMQDATFTATLIIVVTWDTVGHFKCIKTVHTFQGVVVAGFDDTNTPKTYVIQNYKTLSETAIEDDDVMIGINFGATPNTDPTAPLPVAEAIEHAYSCTPDVLKLTSTSNVGCPGTLIYRIDRFVEPNDCTIDDSNMDFTIVQPSGSTDPTKHETQLLVTCDEGYQLVTTGNVATFEALVTCSDGLWWAEEGVLSDPLTCQFTGVCTDNTELYGCHSCEGSTKEECTSAETLTPFVFSTNADGELVYAFDDVDSRGRAGYEEYHDYLASQPRCMLSVVKRRNGNTKVKVRNSNTKLCKRSRAVEEGDCVVDDVADGKRCYECYNPTCSTP